MELSKNEEDYLKALFHLTVEREQMDTTNSRLAEFLNVSPASANGMIKKLGDKKLVNHKKYGSLSLNEEGELIAANLLRKHRLWETFLFGTLHFSREGVHEIAHQLEHIKSDELVERLDEFLGFPKRDCFDNVIPDKSGHYEVEPRMNLNQAKNGVLYEFVTLRDKNPSARDLIDKMGMVFHSKVKVVQRYEYDHSLDLEIDGRLHHISGKLAEIIWVRRIRRV
ncbi:MAG TPA: iron-dependent repressor [Flavobacteriales bacterium]|jgi:DtxR family Mn-dependent transcriptional regulator|nr:iron-dependent repressor [Flavobacteriales bacterium]